MSTIRIITPSSFKRAEMLQERLKEIKNAGFTVYYDEIKEEQGWPFTASSVEVRTRELVNALLEKDTSIILCARGGYGASDLLPHLPWQKLAHASHKYLVGFSDSTALQTALLTKLGWPSLHGPMPAGGYWGKDNENKDIKELFGIFSSLQKERKLKGSLNVKTNETGVKEITGWVFGGCFSVLTNLIGTPYFPGSLAGAVLFLEDQGEHPARLIRFLNQWIQSGVMRGVKAVVLGNFVGLGQGLADNDLIFYHEVKRRINVPLVVSHEFGHVSPNMPFVIGARVAITNDKINWEIENPPAGKGVA